MTVSCASTLRLSRHALLTPRGSGAAYRRVALPYSVLFLQFRALNKQPKSGVSGVLSVAHSRRRAPISSTASSALNGNDVTVSQGTAIGADGAEAVAVNAAYYLSDNNKKPEETQQLKPGEIDDELFQQHPSVAVWRGWYFRDADYATTPERAAAVLQRMVGSVIASSPSDPTSVAYWAYHSARNLFLALQGAASVAYTDTRKALRGESGSTFSPVSMGGRLVAESYECFKQDLDNIRKGVYKLPWDMTNASHRQYNPFFILRSSLRFLAEADKTLSRRRISQAEPVWMESAMYPDYYMSTFHYQTDGWLSSESAGIYETSTETLFIGRQDAMQRNSLIPIHAWLSEGHHNVKNVSLLEVACGTGRFHTFIKDNYPDMRTTALELSPFYLQAARENVKYWAQVTGNTRSASGTRFVQAAAEAIPEPDHSYDVVVSVYLFHELPRQVQEAAVAEMARVVKPGGLIVFTDSIQLGDRPVLDANIAKFEAFNEPHYPAYVNAQIAQMFIDNGLQPDLKSLSSATKTLSFRKPLP